MCTLPHQHAYANSAAVRAVPQRHRVGQAGTPRTELASLLAKVVTLAAGGSLALAAVAGCAPVSNSAAQNPPSEGDRVAVLITGTAHEPRPMLTARALQEVRTAADSTNVTNGPSGKSSSVLVTTADDQLFPVVALTPRRANGAVEHGLQRPKLIEDNLQQVVGTVAAVTATQPGMDLLEGMNDAVSGSEHGVLVVVSNGLSTRGGFDLRAVGWNADPVQIVSQLRERNLLPDLTGWRVLWTGLAATAGDQPPLPKPIRDKLGSYWTAICEAADAVSCQFDESRLDPTPPTTTVETPIVPIPEITSVTAPSGTVTTLPDALLGFGPESAVLSPAAAELIDDVGADIVATLASRPGATVTITGFTADPPESTPAGRRQLSLARAQAVADALTAAGVTHTIILAGGGAAPGTTAMQDGVFIEAIASKMRRTEISY
ncbi:MAG: OmpA family protein [Gemmatimonadota bacterium]|nr:OmpA family protein [Gemmatimonadota bacterium]